MPSDRLPYSTIYLVSTSASTGTASSFSFQMAGMPIENIPGKTVKLGLLSATIPTVFYNVNGTNNGIRINEGGSNVFNTTIPIGNYTAATLVTALNVALNAATVSAVTYTCSLGTGAASNTIIWSTSTATRTITIAANTAQFTARLLLGVQSTTAQTFTSVAPYSSPQPVDLVDYAGPQEIIVRCSQLQSRCYEASVNGMSNIFAVIQNNVTLQSQNLTYGVSAPRIMATAASNVNQLNFVLTDYNGVEQFGVTQPVTMLIGVYHYDDY